MALSDALLPEFDQEMANTRIMLERVPNDKLEWRPHAKSMTMGGLATHLPNILTWVGISLENDTFDMAPKDAPAPHVAPIKSASEALERFDENLAAARATIAAASDEHLLSTWKLLASGETVLAMPRIAVLRSFVMNHTIHHRAQLGLYLRLNDLAVPAIYGPSADEGPAK